MSKTKRDFLRIAGASLLGGSILGGTASAGRGRDDETLRLFGETSVSGAMELVTAGHYAYVATGDGMSVVDWRQPGRPQTVASVDLAADIPSDLYEGESPTLDAKDVKVDGDVAVIANDRENPGGIAVYDVSDPSDPVYQSFYTLDPPSNIHNAHIVDGFAYLALGEPENIENDDDPNRDLVRIFGDAGVEVVDLRDPANPEHASTWLLKDVLPNYAKAGINPCHDLYVQDGLAYCAFWDAGTIVLDVSDPWDPTFVTQFGAAPQADEPIRPWDIENESIGEYFTNVFPIVRYFSLPGNAHYVRPSPDGDHVYVGAETFIGPPGGIDIWDVTDLAAPEKVGHVSPPDVDRFRTSHNFEVTANRLHASWYGGGVTVHDVTDPASPTDRSHYRADGHQFWAAVAERGFTLASSIGSGVVVLHDDRGAKRPPGFGGETGSPDPEVDPRDQA